VSRVAPTIWPANRAPPASAGQQSGVSYTQSISG